MITNSLRLSELRFVLLKILLHFRVRHGQPRTDLLFNPSFAANLLCDQPPELRLRNTAATQGRAKLAFVAKLMFKIGDFASHIGVIQFPGNHEQCFRRNHLVA